MRVQSPDLGWHGLKDRILSIDFHPFSNEFASAGSDEKKLKDEDILGTQGCIKIWQIMDNGLALSQQNKNIMIMYGLPEAVVNTNVVRFSPDGLMLASGADDKCVTIWMKRENTIAINRPQRILRWSRKSYLVGHTEQVLDIQWTRDSKYIVSGGMDKRILVWNVQKNYHIKVLDQHDKFVQGVAIDPTFQHILSSSNDRTTKLWKAIKTKKSVAEFYCKKSFKRFDYVKEEEIPEQKQGFRIFADEGVPTFFRRLSFSPDGELFVLPAGIWERTPSSEPQYCAFVYRKNYLDKPSQVIPMKGEPALVCKFCPKLFKKANHKAGLYLQDYYMVFAIATSSTLLVYNTLELAPIYAMGNFHYAALTDIAWRGQEFLGVSSSDGYCSFMIFNGNQLGEEYQPQGELAERMNVQKKQGTAKVENAPRVEGEMRVEYRQTKGGMKKKIVPKKVGDI